MPLRRWFFAINAAGFDKALPLIQVALASARQSTSLVPVCLYNGPSADHVAQLEGSGAQVIRHRSTLEAELRRGYGDKYDAFSGHWLRIDLPLIETEAKVVLYTDIDVMLRRHPRVARAPVAFAAAPEFLIEQRTHFNSGVLVMNLPRLRRLHRAFTAAIRKRLAGDFTYPAHDQMSFNDFFARTPLNRLRRRAFTPLDPALNWKPYWGVNPDASIIHFHGPKPRHAARMIADPEFPGPKNHRVLVKRSRQGYGAYIAQWEKLAKSAGVAG